VTCLDKTCQNQESETSSDNEEENRSDSSEDILNVIEETFEDSSPLAINKIRNWNRGETKNYYPRPTPLNLQYEERGNFTSSHFDGSSVHQWNIDGKSEHEILNTLQEMIMACATYKAKKFKGREAATAIIIGFTG